MHQNIPLATLIRPKTLEDFIGQKHLLSENKPLFQAIKNGNPYSMLLWGPPGTGKTTLARLFAEHPHIVFINLSAVMAGLKEVRAAIEQAIRNQEKNQLTLLFIDEVHRFNKNQQDVFLPFIENGTIIFIGATTENPSFEINRALLSRCQIYILKPLEEKEILEIIDRALVFLKSSRKLIIEFDIALRERLAELSHGDARYALNILELALSITPPKKNKIVNLTESVLKQSIATHQVHFDKKRDFFYDQISALHKSVRGSNPDAALYWLARMLVGGVDPLYIARRVVRMASEDIGNAEPIALQLALNALEVQERLGSPEGELALGQAVIYMAVAPKSNAVYTAFKAAIKDAEEWSTEAVPIHLRNAPTPLMRNLGYGKAYRYDHNEPNAFAAGQTYFPEKMGERTYYQPVPRGLEIKIQEKLKNFQSLKEQYKNQKSTK